MLRHGGVVILYEVNDISDGIIVMKFEDMLDSNIEGIFRVIFILNLFYLLFGQVNEIVLTH